MKGGALVSRVTAMRGWRIVALPAAFAVVSAAVLLCPASLAQPAGRPCGGAEIARGTVEHVIDGRTVMLADGREVRLAGVEVPPQDAAGMPGAAAAKSALQALAGGDEVALRGAEIATDRYGRIVAYAYTLRDGDELFVQGELVAAGSAWVGNRVGSRACAIALLNREAEARKAKYGLWADPAYQVLDTAAPAALLARRGRFVLAEGLVFSVRTSGATVYVNFARRWSEGFAVTVEKRRERIFAAAGVELSSLAGRRVRVRGFVETRDRAESRPSIDLERPEQIEIAGGD